MTEFNNDITKNPNYITKSKIDGKFIKSLNLPKGINVKFVKECFENAPFKYVKTGNPYNEYMQRHTKVVSKKDLQYEIFKEYRSIKRR